MAGRHVDAVCAIDSRCFSRPWSAVQWRTELAADDRTHLVARDNDHVVAHAGTLRGVLDDSTSRPLPSTLTTKARARHPPLHRVAAPRHCRRRHRRDPRVRAQAPPQLYGRLGFAPAGIRSRYYDRPTDDAIIMWLHDLDSPEIGSGSIRSLLNSTRSPMEPPR